MIRKGIYVREEDEYVGPFNSREDAERFLVLVELSGESSKGIEIVEIDNAAAAVSKAVSAEERQQLLDNARTSAKGLSSRPPKKSTASSRHPMQDKKPRQPCR